MLPPPKAVVKIEEKVNPKHTVSMLGTLAIMTILSSLLLLQKLAKYTPLQYLNSVSLEKPGTWDKINFKKKSIVSLSVWQFGTLLQHI